MGPSSKGGANGKYVPRNLRALDAAIYQWSRFEENFNARSINRGRNSVFCRRRCSPSTLVYFLSVAAYIALVCMVGAWIPTVFKEINGLMTSDTVHNVRPKAAPTSDPNRQGTVTLPSSSLKAKSSITSGVPATEIPPKLLRVCSNVPPEGARIQPRKEAISMETVELELLGDRGYNREKKLSTAANATLSGLVEKRRAMRALRENVTTLDEEITKMGLALDVDDYRILPGGHWTPTSCRPRWKVAIVVPFRNRFEHLPVFLRHIIPFLKRQQLEFSIFITEQRNDLPFNRAMLMNVGFVEALNFTNFDCVVFHDVDHMALNGKNYFGCENMPRHFISGEAVWEYKLLYENLFGGVTGVTTAQFHDINGVPNVYWGWGGEDDEFLGRVQAKGYNKTRPAGDIGYFDTMTHQSVEHSLGNPARFCLLQHFKERTAEDGLSNLVYDRPLIQLHPLYTFISVNIQRLPWKPAWNLCSVQ